MVGEGLLCLLNFVHCLLFEIYYLIFEILISLMLFNVMGLFQACTDIHGCE